MDARARAHALTRDRMLRVGVPEAQQSGAPRQAVAASWRRVAASGVDPGGAPAIAPLSDAEIQSRRRGSGLASRVEHLGAALGSVLDAGQLVVVADRDGRVLWRLGGAAAKRRADRLEFVGGSAWTEANVGTNAIGTCLVVGEGVAIHGAEHFVDAHVPWGCAAAPLRDPWTDEVVGVLDVSGPSEGLHPAELALVEAVARLTAHEVLAEHRGALERLRCVAAPVLARLDAPALAVDHSGHLAGVNGALGSAAPARLALPDDLGPGHQWLPALGSVLVEPLPGGWLLRVVAAAETEPIAAGVEVALDLGSRPCVRVAGSSGSWTSALTQRHAEILAALHLVGDAGRTAAGLADDLFADPTRIKTVRAEMSRLRRTFGALLKAQPYRFAPGVEVTVEGDPLLPGSSAPVTRRLREQQSLVVDGRDSERARRRPIA